MGITVIGATIAVQSGSEIVSVAAPTVADDDLLIAHYVHNDNDVEPVTLTGFTQIESGVEDATGNDTTLACLYKVASSESGAYSITGTTPVSAQKSLGSMLSLRGINTASPIDVTYVQATHYLKTSNNGGTTPKPITTESDGAMVVLFIDVLGTVVTDFTAPTGYEKQVQEISSNSHGAVFTKVVTSQGTETPGEITAANIGVQDEVVMITISIAADAGSENPYYYYAQQ